MINPGYSKVVHIQGWTETGEARYAIDWSDDRERKYKQVEHCLRFYEDGDRSIHNNTYRQVALRSRLCRDYDVDFRLLGQITGKLLSPDGEVIPKTWIKTEIMLRDDYSRRLLAGGYSGRILFEKNKLPESAETIKISVPQPDKEKEFLKQYEDVFNLAITVSHLHPNIQTFWNELDYALRNLQTHKKKINPAKNEDARLLCALAKIQQPDNRRNFLRQLRDVTSIPKEFPYLIVKE